MKSSPVSSGGDEKYYTTPEKPRAISRVIPSTPETPSRIVDHARKSHALVATDSRGMGRTRSRGYRRRMEEIVGKIPSTHHVHHVDGDPSNGSQENLVVIPAEEHRLIHTCAYAQKIVLGSEFPALYRKYTAGECNRREARKVERCLKFYKYGSDVERNLERRRSYMMELREKRPSEADSGSSQGFQTIPSSPQR